MLSGNFSVFSIRSSPRSVSKLTRQNGAQYFSNNSYRCDRENCHNYLFFRHASLDLLCFGIIATREVVTALPNTSVPKARCAVTITGRLFDVTVTIPRAIWQSRSMKVKVATIETLLLKRCILKARAIVATMSIVTRIVHTRCANSSST